MMANNTKIIGPRIGLFPLVDSWGNRKREEMVNTIKSERGRKERPTFCFDRKQVNLEVVLVVDIEEHTVVSGLTQRTFQSATTTTAE
jgi:hypothetical protein